MISPRSLALLAACLPWSPSARFADASCRRSASVGSSCEAGEDDSAQLQAKVVVSRAASGEHLSGSDTAEEASSKSDEVHTVFTCDCRPFNLWQAELLFFSAQRVGQLGPITQIVSGCSPEQQRHVKQRHAGLGVPLQYKVHFVQEFNDNRSHCLNKPYGIAAWFREVGPAREVVAIVDPDFLFVRPLTATIDGAPFSWQDWSKSGQPLKVQKGVVVSQRWTLIAHAPTIDYPWRLPLKVGAAPPGMTNDELLTWVCSGSKTGDSGCTGVTAREVGIYHASGVPYMAHRDDMDEWLVDSWRDITERLHTVYDGYIIDMLSWVLATIHHRQREVLLPNFQLYHPHENDWAAVDRLTVDPCTAPMDEVLADPRLGHFIHYTHYRPAWNKRWFDHPWSGPHVFERCDVAADDEWLLQLVDTSEDARTEQRRWSFLVCVTRRMFAGALKRTCAGRPAAALVDKVAAGFTF